MSQTRVRLRALASLGLVLILFGASAPASAANSSRLADASATTISDLLPAASIPTTTISGVADASVALAVRHARLSIESDTTSIDVSASPASSLTRFRQSATYVHTTAADIVRSCYTWAGTDSLRNPSALGRCLRDISGATQHVFVDPLTMVDAAPALLAHWAGEEPHSTCPWHSPPAAGRPPGPRRS